MDYLCDDLGMDTIDVGGAFGVAMEAGYIPFGDFYGMKKILLSLYGEEAREQ
jgi:aldehyde:ferredoxin oxidoreductase